MRAVLRAGASLTLRPARRRAEQARRSALVTPERGGEVLAELISRTAAPANLRGAESGSSLRSGGLVGPTFGSRCPRQRSTRSSRRPAGDERAFSKLTDRFRRELQSHCYRVTGSVEDSEDLVQETCCRAWQSRASFRGRPTRPGSTGSPATRRWMRWRRRRRPLIADGLDAVELSSGFAGRRLSRSTCS